MSDDEAARLHSAGAVVRHSSPFHRLEVSTRQDNPSRDFIQKWVQPFYLQNLWQEPSPFVEAVRGVAPELTEAVTAELLSYFNWRPRIVGAYFVAIKRFAVFEEQVGRLLLRSDLCDAGRGYCTALARLGSPAAIAFLEEYLEYYLGRADLWFDQDFAMAALGYLDQQNGTERRARFVPPWERFVADKPDWDLAQTDGIFAATLRTLDLAAAAAVIPDR